MENIYLPPEAELKDKDPNAFEYGSIENALKGNYEVPIFDTISEAWDLVRGSKGSFFLSIVIMWIISTIPGQILFRVFSTENFGTIIVSQYTIWFLMVPMYGGLVMMGTNRALSTDISFKMIFDYYPKIIPMVLLVALGGFFIILGTFLLGILSIYLGVGYCFSLHLLLDRGMKFTDALKYSRVAVTRHWFRLFGFLFMLWLIVVISYLPATLASMLLFPKFMGKLDTVFAYMGFNVTWLVSILGFGLIWTIPLFWISMGIMYKRIFGVATL